MAEQEPKDPQEPTPEQPEGAGEAPQPPTPPPAPAKPKPDIGAYLKAGWGLVIGDPVLLIVGYLVVSAIIGVSSLLFVGPIILAGPLMFGYLRVVQKRLNGEEATFGEIFGGFQDFGKAFLTTLLLSLIGVVVTIVVLIAALIGAFIPCVGWLLAFIVILAVSVLTGAVTFFVMPIAALTDASPTDSIAQSFKFCFANFGWVLLLSLVAWGIGSAGTIVCGVGVLFTVPLALAMNVAAYNDYYQPNA